MESIYQRPCFSAGFLLLVVSIAYFRHFIFIIFHRHDGMVSFDIFPGILQNLAQEAKQQVISLKFALKMNACKST